jgi:GTP-binding protein
LKFRAKFITSVAKFADCPKDGVPEIALLGRSNVGKSSLINAMTEQRGLAKTSSTPGKTQLLNYFLINDSFYLVDMPGYGYAKAGAKQRIEWAKLSQKYLEERLELKLVGLLVDSRHPALASDVAAIEWLTERNIPLAIVLTKIDKLRQQELKQHEKELKHYAESAVRIIPTSVETKRGIGILREFLQEIVSGSLVG